MAGRFGYSDLKEAALTEPYVLCIGQRGCRGIRKRLSWVRSDGLKGGWRKVVACGGLKWRLERRAFVWFWPDETRSPRARRSTSRSRGWEQGFKRHTGLVAVASEAGVAQRRAVRRRAWFRRRPGSSRVNESDLWTVVTPKQVFLLDRRATGSRAAGAKRGCGWQESRSCGCARSPGAADAAGSGAGTLRHPRS